MSLLSVVSARILKSGSDPESSTDCMESSCRGYYSRRVPGARYHIGRGLSAQSPESPTMIACRHQPLLDSRTTAPERHLAYVVFTLPGHLVGCCCARWAYVVRRVVRSCAAFCMRSSTLKDACRRWYNAQNRSSAGSFWKLCCVVPVVIFQRSEVVSVSRNH